MTKLLDEALDAVRRLPSDTPDDIARAMLEWAGRDDVPEPVDPEHLPSVLEGLAQARRRQFATRAEVEAALRCFDAISARQELPQPQHHPQIQRTI